MSGVDLRASGEPLRCAARVGYGVQALVVHADDELGAGSGERVQHGGVGVVHPHPHADADASQQRHDRLRRREVVPGGGGAGGGPAGEAYWRAVL